MVYQCGSKINKHLTDQVKTMNIKLNDKGLVPAIAQDCETNEILMLGYMNPGSLRRTMEGGQVWFYSRSQEDLWHKGEVSGNYLNVKEAWLDCDADTILLKVDPDGPTCHTGEKSCFFNALDQLPESYESTEINSGILEELFAIIKDRQSDPKEGSYTNQLLAEGVSRIGQKVIEEAGETALSAVAKDDESSIVNEIADLLFHTMVLMAASNISPKAVWEELYNRKK